MAHRHDVHPNLLHHWRRQARRVTSSRTTVGFLPVAVAKQDSPAERSGTIEIDLTGGVRVRVDAAVDEAALGRVLRALGR